MKGAIFACDSSTAMCSVAIKAHGQRYTETVHAQRDHLQVITPIMRRVFAKATLSISDIGLSVCSRGPGSFVGLRIALNTVKGFYAGRDIPFVTIPTHEIYRWAYRKQDAPVVAVIRATKRAFYVGGYYRGNDVLPVRQMTVAELAAAAARLTREHRRAAIITSVDAPLLTQLAAEIGGDTVDGAAEAGAAHTTATGAASVAAAGTAALLSGRKSVPYRFTALPSSAMPLCDLAQVVYAERGMDALDVNPYYLRTIDAEK